MFVMLLPDCALSSASACNSVLVIAVTPLLLTIIRRRVTARRAEARFGLVFAIVFCLLACGTVIRKCLLVILDSQRRAVVIFNGCTGNNPPRRAHRYADGCENDKPHFVEVSNEQAACRVLVKTHCARGANPFTP